MVMIQFIRLIYVAYIHNQNVNFTQQLDQQRTELDQHRTVLNNQEMEIIKLVIDRIIDKIEWELSS